MPHTRNTSIRAKDTSRIEARRRYREEQRAQGLEPEPEVIEVSEAPAPSRPMFGMPDVRGDLASLPQVFRKPLVWLPFGMLLGAFALVLAIDAGVLPEGAVADMSALYVSLTLPPTSLFVFFIGGFVAQRASYMVGGLLGAFDALLLSLLYVLVPTISSNSQLQEAGLTTGQEQAGAITVDQLAPLWGIAIFVGIFAGGFAAWYKRFLRSSQERARANRAIREQEQARKAKEQARLDKQTARDVKRAR